MFIIYTWCFEFVLERNAFGRRLKNNVIEQSSKGQSYQKYRVL